ncbi:uncharacterized protein V6R79_024059 [Siganus canaliculatus]
MTSAALSVLWLCVAVCGAGVVSSLSVLWLCVAVCGAGVRSAPSDDFLGPPECLDRNFTRESCDLVFCPPWQRCSHGRCHCKVPYQCPTEVATPVCSLDNRKLRSYCQAMAFSCQTQKSFMSHFGETCTADQLKFSSYIEPGTGVIRMLLPASGEEALVCATRWNMAAANVACREEGHPLGAKSTGTVQNRGYQPWPKSCVAVRCQGYESSLAECVIYDKIRIDTNPVATATCEVSPEAGRQCDFTCVNGKCVSVSQTCDGVDDCGDRSDEMCCKKCRGGAYRCSSGVCVPPEAVGDGQLDCLDGGDEAHKPKTRPVTSLPVLTTSERVSPLNETKATRIYLESMLSCGIPKTSTADVEDELVAERGGRGRVRRVVGGVPSNSKQIQWQVAVYQSRSFQCGGAFIGECWVLTAAHCIRSDTRKMVAKFSLWSRSRAQDTTDIVPVQEVFVHPDFDRVSGENDIALLQLQTLPHSDQCMVENPAVSAVCLPWTRSLFQPNQTCTVSGWGHVRSGRGSQYLQWGNVTLIEDCHRFYQDRIKPGMICAGDLDGSVDSCLGDSGGPLVCQNQLGVSYLWGVVSWGEGCGRPQLPGVYTQVAHYFEWIRKHTGWSAVTKFNS